MKMTEFENPFTRNDIKKAVITLHRIRHMEINTINPYDLLTALEALDQQYPMAVEVTRKPGEKTALITCSSCRKQVIVTYELHREHYRDWYCKACGQRLCWPEDVFGNKLGLDTEEDVQNGD